VQLRFAVDAAAGQLNVTVGAVARPADPLPLADYTLQLRLAPSTEVARAQVRVRQCVGLCVRPGICVFGPF
jgi:hypothetical protein